MATAVALVSESADHQVKAFEGEREDTLDQIYNWFDSMGEMVAYEYLESFDSDVVSRREVLEILASFQEKYVEEE